MLRWRVIDLAKNCMRLALGATTALRVGSLGSTA